MALLEVSDVTVQFGGVTAVDGASITAEQGRITGLIGPNGAGKTTLFNVITGLQPATRGTVHFDRKNLNRWVPSRRARAGMGRTFQRLEAFGSLTVRENVQVAAEIHAGVRGVFWNSGGTVDELLARVGISSYAAQRADSVPTGVARLLEMARVLAVNPQLLLLDEPSSGLDESETAAFGGLLRELAAEDKAILLVEHDMDLVMSVCDVIHVLEFGRIIASGTPEEIRANVRVQEAYLGAEPAEPEPAMHDTSLLPVAEKFTEEIAFPGRHRGESA